MAVVNNSNVYNYILANYVKPGESRQSRFDSHKRSELRSHYNRIVKSNKDNPLYKVNMSNDDVTKFAIDLKESARRTENLISSLTVDGDDLENLFHKLVATSSQEDSVDVEYIGENDAEPSRKSFDLGVNSLARPQTNTGNYLPGAASYFETGSYTFDLDTPSNSYEFQFNVLDNDTNLDVQNRIARLINTSDISLSATVLTGDDGTSAISITSKQTGLSENEKYLFNISAGDTGSRHELDVLGIADITTPAASSSFTLNGQEHSSLSNTFTINNDFEITLKAPTDGEARIGFKTNTDAIADSTEDLISAFNNFLSTGEKYEQIGGDSQLKREMSALYRNLATELESVGIIRDPSGNLSLDRETLSSAITTEDPKPGFSALNHFKDALKRQAQKTAVNPMDYVSKITVEYKNPGKNFSYPYAESRYAGLLLDQTL